jgi:nitrile hydratase beta subunit
MNGIHDLGGMHGFGPVEREADEPVFHDEWERRVFALTLAAGYLGRWNLDMSRHAREHMPAAEYLATSYYEHWLWGLERLLDGTGLTTRGELQTRIEDAGAPHRQVALEGLRVLDAEAVQPALRSMRGARVEQEIEPGFRAGDAVRARNLNPTGHTRLPRYCRGKRGSVAADQGVWVFPDTHAAGLGKKAQHVYSVRFAAAELWGDGAPARDFVYVDLWEDYLEPA